MALTFLSLAAVADFDAVPPVQADDEVEETDLPEPPERPVEPPEARGATNPHQAAPPGSEMLKLGGFVYNIELHLPESRDPAVYDAFFRSLKTHLLS